MMRVAAVVVLLWALTWLRGPYQAAMVPTRVTGDMLAGRQPGLVTFNGTVLNSTITNQGGRTYKVQVDSQQIIVYAGPLSALGPLDVGSRCSFTGKMLAEGVVSVQDRAGVKVQVPTDGIMYRASTGPAGVNERVEFPVTNFAVLRASAGTTHRVEFEANGRLWKGSIAEDYVNAVRSERVAKVRGYLQGHTFVMEGWSQ